MNLYKPFFFSDVCKRLNAHSEFSLRLLHGSPIVVRVCPLGRPRFFIATGILIPMISGDNAK